MHARATKHSSAPMDAGQCADVIHTFCSLYPHGAVVFMGAQGNDEAECATSSCLDSQTNSAVFAGRVVDVSLSIHPCRSALYR